MLCTWRQDLASLLRRMRAVDAETWTGMPTSPPPALHPGTGQPIGPDDLAPLFPMDLIMQEVTTEQYVDIPDEVFDVYRLWRPSPVFRAHRLEKALGTCHTRQGGHQEADHQDRGGAVGDRAGVRLRPVRPAPRSLSLSKVRSLSLSKGVAGAGVRQPEAVPADDDRNLRRHRAPEPVGADRGRPGDPGRASRLTRLARIAISEAVEVATQDGGINYALGSVLNDVLMHQTIIGEEVLLQLAKIGETADLLVGCTGGGSNFGGLEFRVPARELGRPDEPGGDRRGAERLPVADPGQLRLRLRRHRRDDAAAEDAHPGPRLHP